MDRMLTELLSSSTETEVLEFKRATWQYERDKLGRYFSALSNEANLKGKSSAWILKDSNGIEKDYEHFSCPFFLAVNEVFGKIRNIKYSLQYLFNRNKSKSYWILECLTPTGLDIIRYSLDEPRHLNHA